MKTFALTTAVALFAAAGFAQAPVQPAQALQTIDKARPFGALDIKAVDGRDVSKVTAWAKTLSESQKLDMSNRCSVVGANATSFLPDDVALCQTWTLAQAGEIAPANPPAARP